MTRTIKAKAVVVGDDGSAQFGEVEIEPQGAFFAKRGMNIGTPETYTQSGEKSPELAEMRAFVRGKIAEWDVNKVVEFRGAMRELYHLKRRLETTVPGKKPLPDSQIFKEMQSTLVFFVRNPQEPPDRAKFMSESLYKKELAARTIRITVTKDTDHQHIVFRPGYGIAFSLFAEALLSRKGLASVGLVYELYDLDNELHTSVTRTKAVFTDLTQLEDSDEEAAATEQIFSSFINFDGLEVTPIGNSGIVAPVTPAPKPATPPTGAFVGDDGEKKTVARKPVVEEPEIKVDYGDGGKVVDENAG